MRTMIPAITKCSEAARRTDLLEESLLICIKTMPRDQLPESVAMLRDSYERAREAEVAIYTAYYADSRGAHARSQQEVRSA
jgi:hypothetical protein